MDPRLRLPHALSAREHKRVVATEFLAAKTHEEATVNKHG
jgi:hypothetical protein